MNVGYALRRIAEKWDDPRWRRYQILDQFVGRIHPFIYWDGGISVVDEDWDNLIVLDACRADLFEEVADRDEFDEYRRVTSNASNTTPWTRKNFGGHSLGDIVYVTANPVTSKEAPNAFHELREVWTDGYHPDHHTILPEPVVEETLAAIELARELPGRSVIMSDHGNMLGERTIPPIRVFGHPPGLRCPELVTVPWAVIEGGERPEIVSEEVQSRTEYGTLAIKQRLHELGYVE
jgi:hypothetical protein